MKKLTVKLLIILAGVLLFSYTGFFAGKMYVYKQFGEMISTVDDRVNAVDTKLELWTEAFETIKNDCTVAPALVEFPNGEIMVIHAYTFDDVLLQDTDITKTLTYHE